MKIYMGALCGAVLFAGMVGYIAYLVQMPAPRDGTTVVPRSSFQAPNKIEWSRYPVGGLVLCKPPYRDSLGKPHLDCSTIPPGAILSLPRTVPNPDTIGTGI